MNAEHLASKVWNFCHTLRDDGVSYGDYLEQLTYLIFLKMADEYRGKPWNHDIGIPEEYDWNSLKARKGAELEAHYIELLRTLGQQKGMLGQIFTKAQNKIQDPAKLARLIEMIDASFYAHGVKANVLFFDGRPGRAEPWTEEIWYYDYRTNIHHTLKKKPLRDEHLKDFIACYKPGARHKRKQTWSEENPEGRLRRYTREEIFKRDKTSLDIFWLRDQSLGDLDNLPEPDDIAEEIIENLESGLESFRSVLNELER